MDEESGNFLGYTEEQLQHALERSRIVDKCAHILRVPCRHIPGRIEQMIGELENNRAKIRGYEIPAYPLACRPVIRTS